jgi:hypothetical protein
MNHITPYLFLGLSLSAVAYGTDQLPAWAAKNPDGHEVRIAVALGCIGGACGISD